MKNALIPISVLVAAALTGCTQTDDSRSGDLRMGLIGSDAEGNLYRLRDGLFDITGASPIVLSTEDSPDPVESLIVDVLEGPYAVLLEDGWRVERFDAATDTAQDVASALISANPVSANVVAGATTPVVFEFFVDGAGPVAMGEGTVDIDVSFSDGCELITDPAQCDAFVTCEWDAAFGVCVGAGAACAPDEFCASAAPIGWDGPVALLAGVDPCPSQLPTQVDVAFDDLQVPAHTCGCECGEPESTNCGAATMLARGPNNCIDEDFVTPQVQFEPGVCTPVSSFLAGSWTADLANFPLEAVTSGSCTPVQNVDVPPTTWGQDFRTCALATPPTTCESGGTCQPDLGLGGAPMCVFRSGDHPCPAGDYSERQLVFLDVADARDCSDCSCGAPAGMCNGSILFASDCGALPILFDVAPVDQCTPVSNQVGAGTYALQPDAACAPAGGVAQGTAAPDAPLTMCCLP